MRGLVLPPLLIGGFGFSVWVFGLRADFVWYLFVGLLGILATPVAFFEAALHERSPEAQTLAAGSLLVLVTAAAWLLLGQTIYSLEVFTGRNQAGALSSSVDFMTQVSLRDVVAFLLPLSFPFAGSFWLELRGIRRRWQPLLLLICLPPAMILLGLFRAGAGDANALDVVIVLAASLLIPVANGLAALATRWRERRAEAKG